MQLIRLFVDNLLPILLAAGTGYLLAMRLGADARPLAHAAFFVFAPCLVFRLILESEVPPGVLLRMVSFTAMTLLGLAGVTALIARWIGLPRPMTAAVVLSVLLPNAGNYGLSASRLAFGEAGLAHASLFFATAAAITYTVGVVVASLGRASVGRALSSLPRVPAIWAVVAAFVMAQWGLRLPGPLERTTWLLSEACIPTMLVVLGMQMHGAGWRAPIRPLVLATGMRLLGGVAVGFLAARLFRLEGAARQAGLLQAAMPPAVICIVLATEYDVEPGFVTSAVLCGTLLSPLSLTPLLALLGA